MVCVPYSWHALKRQENLKNHKRDFADAADVFAGPIFTFEDDREDYGEQRWGMFGLLGLKVVLIVHPETVEVTQHSFHA